MALTLLAEEVNWTTPVLVISKPPPDAALTVPSAELAIAVRLAEFVMVCVSSALVPAVPGSALCSEIKIFDSADGNADPLTQSRTCVAKYCENAMDFYI